MEYKILSNVSSPNDIKKLSINELKALCDEIRDCIINTVSKNGGHLASNLGAVELTVALHYVFNSPDDSIVFDVGHQCYTHKLLTGRYDSFSSLRLENGISGFTRPNESEHDAFVSGHSSTALSSAYGLLKGKELLGKDGRVIAVVGDGAMTGGMAYEALNNAGRDKSNNGLIIILNDNEMSISKNVGALARYLSAIRQKKSYFNFKRDIKRILSHTPLIGGFIGRNLQRSKDMLKHRIYRSSNIFEGFGFEYFGPTDGHDIEKLIDLLNIIKEEKRPVVLHTKTTKGKGYTFAETDPGLYHGVGPFSLECGVEKKNTTDFSSVFGSELSKMAEKNCKICAVTAAMPDGTGLHDFAKKFPQRFFDVGIAEEHAVTFSAGLAKSGMKPYFAVYSSFLQRAVDQIIHDTAIEDLNVTFCIDRAGFVGADGETHQGLYDVPLLSAIPKMNIYSPSNYNELRFTLNNSALSENMQAIRYPRGGESTAFSEYMPSGKDYDVFGDGDIAVISYGAEFVNVYSALSQEKNICLIKLNKIFPINESLYGILLSKKRIYFFEESSLQGSIGEKLGASLCKFQFSGAYEHVAAKGFVPTASVACDYNKFNLDIDSIKKIVLEK